MENLAFPASHDPCGREDWAGRGGLMTVGQALSRGLALARPVEKADVLPLQDVTGRVLGEDIFAPFPLPPFDSAAMDGYAINTAGMSGDGPWTFRVRGRVAAGDDPNAAGVLKPGQAHRIFTGAAIPEGASAVVMQERVMLRGDQIEIAERQKPDACIRRAGEDAAEGARLVPRGTVIGAREAGLIASVGCPEVRVLRKVRITLMSTGSELRQPGQPLGPGQIYNSNRFMMLAALQLPWADLTDFGAVPDDPGLLRKKLLMAAQHSDMVVTTGGVSVGDEDHVVEQLRRAGGEIDVLKIAMKPGKPLMFGTLGRALVIGLPGNPVAAYTTWKVIGARIAERIAGMPPAEGPRRHAELVSSVTRRPGRQEYRPAKIVGIGTGGHPRIELLDATFSAKISRLCVADGFAVIPALAESIAAGERLEFLSI